MDPKEGTLEGRDPRLRNTLPCNNLSSKTVKILALKGFTIRYMQLQVR